MQPGAKRAITTASVRTTIQVLLATLLVALAQKVPVLRDINTELLLTGAVALVVAGQQALEHRFPLLAVVLRNNGPIFLTVLEHFREGVLDAEDEPGSVVVSLEPEDPSEESDAAAAEAAV